MDRAVYGAHGKKRFTREAVRGVVLFERYQVPVSLLTAEGPAKRRARGAKLTR